MEHPDRWVVVHITGPNTDFYRVFATWYGGFAGSDSWQINSGIVKCIRLENGWDFHGITGSVYRCFDNSWGTSGWSGGVLRNFIDKAQNQGHTITVVNKTTDYRELNYENCSMQ